MCFDSLSACLQWREVKRIDCKQKGHDTKVLKADLGLVLVCV